MKQFQLLFLLLVFLISNTGCHNIFGDRAEPLPVATSDSFLNQIQITSPKYADIWNPGSNLTIIWNASSSIKSIKIELYRKKAFQRVITESVSNKGSFTWNIPEGISPSIHYHFKLINTASTDEYTLSERFGILNK